MSYLNEPFNETAISTGTLFNEVVHTTRVYKANKKKRSTCPPRKIIKELKKIGKQIRRI